MSSNSFDQLQERFERARSELAAAQDNEERKELLREMRALIDEADQLLGQDSQP